MKKALLTLALLPFMLILIYFLWSNYGVTGRVVFPAGSKNSGEIYALSTEPEIVVLNEAAVFVGVQNTANEKQSYKLYLFITKDGVVRESFDFVFTLKPGRGVTFSPTFIPNALGEYEILAKLYDDPETKILDSRRMTIASTSKVGPFDLILDILAKTIGPGESLPIILRMKNTGELGSEVKVRVKMYCETTAVGDEFFIFLEPKKEKERVVSLLTCHETGLHTVSAELELFNTSLAASSSDVFLKEHPTLRIKVPEKIEIKQGDSKILDIEVENTANTSINNLKFALENLPVEWSSATPFIIASVSPGEVAIFMLNLSVPQEAEAREYPIKISVGANELFASEKSYLSVLGVAKEEEAAKPLLKLPKIITAKNKSLIIIVMAVFLIAFLVARRKLKSIKSSNEIYKKRAAILKILKR